MRKTISISILTIIMSLTFHSFATKKDTSKKAISTVSITRLSLETATKLAQAAIKTCRKKGIQIAATVVDRNGLVQVTLRDTIAAPFATRVSILKAYTAANFSVNTSQLKQIAKSPVSRVDGVMMGSGGVVVKVGGKLLGAIGVSGAPSGVTDEECAKAGIKKLISDLEFDM